MYISGFMLDAGRPQRLEDRKMRRIKANKPFPFFKLPTEIRHIIYEKVFSTSLNDKVLTPDPTYSRRRYNEVCRQRGVDSRRVINRTIINGLALLQSCQQAHEEAAAVLYSQNTFCFDDSQQLEPYALWSDYGRKTFVTEVSAHCDYCRRHARTNDFNDRCYDACSSGEHFIKIPFTDFLTMKRWLSDIGERNRLRIRHIQIHFSDSRFAKVQPADYWTMSQRVGKPCPVGGDVLAEALEFLAFGHNLDTFGIFFDSSTRDHPDGVEVRQREHRKAFGHLFSTVYHPYSDKMKTALSGIVGIRNLICEGLIDVVEQETPEINSLQAEYKKGVNAAQAEYRKVKAVMEYGYGKHLKLVTPVLWSKIYADQIEWVMQDPKSKAKKNRLFMTTVTSSK